MPKVDVRKFRDLARSLSDDLDALKFRVGAAFFELRNRERQHEHGDRTKSETYGEAARIVGEALSPSKPKVVRQAELFDSLLEKLSLDHYEEPMNKIKLFGNPPFESSEARVLWRIVVGEGTPRERILELSAQKVGLTWAGYVLNRAIGNAYSTAKTAAVGIERFVRDELLDAADIMGIRGEVEMFLSQVVVGGDEPPKRRAAKKKSRKKPAKKAKKRARR